jgi:signal transduction histidine kinase
VSHELRSPLARMKVALEFMPEGAKREALAKDIREMENLIAVLLEREGLRSRADRFEGEQIDLKGIVGQVVASFSGCGPGVEFVCVSEAPLHADPELLRLLIQNLVDNAVKFSHPDSAPVAVKLKAEKAGLVLTVEDDGIGIPPGSSEQLFKPFVKGDASRGHGVGYGVGLSLCQRIVQLHGGTIRLRERLPRGTTVEVTLGRSAE